MKNNLDEFEVLRKIQKTKNFSKELASELGLASVN